MFQNDTDHLDQHFLVDKDIIEAYINFPKFNKNDQVVEIGPGKGVLSKRIAPLVGSLTLIELDARLAPYLEKIPHTRIIYKNVLEADIPPCNKIITSLPYSIIEPFMHKFSSVPFDSMYMLMGINYINHVLEDDLTVLAMYTNCYFKVTKLLDVSKNAFDYPPRTESAIIEIKHVEKESLDKRHQLYRELFYRDNKKIKNSLQEILIQRDSLTKKQAKEIVEKLELPSLLADKVFGIISNDDLMVLDKYIRKLI